MSDNNVIVTVKGRFVGGGLFEPRAREEGKEPRYSATVVLEKAEAKKIESITKAAIVQKWGSKVPAGLVSWGLREGDDPEFEASYGNVFINPKATRAPDTVTRINGKINKVTREEDIIYPGCYVAASVSAYAYEGDRARSIKPGVTLNLRAVLFLKDGERLDNSVDSDKEFDGYNSVVASGDGFDDPVAL